MGFSHVDSLDDLNNTWLCPGCILEVAPREGKVGRTYIPEIEERGKEPPTPYLGSVHGSTSGCVLSITITTKKAVLI